MIIDKSRRVQPNGPAVFGQDGWVSKVTNTPVSPVSIFDWLFWSLVIVIVIGVLWVI